MVSDTNVHHGSEEGLSHHRKIHLESFKSQKLLLLPKVSMVRGGLPSTWIRADTELSVCPFYGSCWATPLLPGAAPLLEQPPQFICVHSRSWLKVWGISFDWFSTSSWNRAPTPSGTMAIYLQGDQKAPSKQAQVSLTLTVREEIF